MDAKRTDFLADEIRYWDHRYGRQGETAVNQYGRDVLSENLWDLYRYARYLLRLPRDARIVEFGAGDVAKGLYLTTFQGFSRVVVTDVSVHGLLANRQCAADLGTRTQPAYAVMAGEELGFRDGSCDAIFCHSALHHVADPARAVASAARCLAPGGLLILGHEPNRLTYGLLRRTAGWLHLTERQTSAEWSVADAEVMGFTRGELVRWAERAGLEVVEVQPIWFLQGLVILSRETLARLAGKHARLPGALERLVGWTDGLIARVPGLRGLPLYWSLIGRKRAAPA